MFLYWLLGVVCSFVCSTGCFVLFFWSVCLLFGGLRVSACVLGLFLLLGPCLVDCLICLVLLAWLFDCLLFVVLLLCVHSLYACSFSLVSVFLRFVLSISVFRGRYALML